MPIEISKNIFQPGDKVIYNPVGYDISSAAQRSHDQGVVIKFDGYYVHMRTFENNEIMRILCRSVNHYPPKENLKRIIHIII
jgi:hypothetical protein